MRRAIALATRQSSLQRPLHLFGTDLDSRPDLRTERVRQNVRNPDDAAGGGTLGEYLKGGMVVRHPHPSAAHDGVCQPARLLIDIDDQFAHLPAIVEGQNPGIPFQVSVHHAVRQEAGVHSTDIAERLPYQVWRGGDDDLLYE